MKTYIMFSIVGILCGTILYSNAEDNQYIYDSYSPYKNCHIHPNEWRDTTLILKRPRELSLSWIFQQIASTQRIGREQVEYDSYSIKTESLFCSQPFISNYFTNANPDTIFIKETINNDGTYSMSVWQTLDSIYSLPDVVGHITLFTKSNFKYLGEEGLREYNYITSWRKKELLEYGRDKYPNGFYTSNPSPSCVSRIIIKPKTVRIDMFKYYSPFWPEDIKYNRYLTSRAAKCIVFTKNSILLF